MACYHAEIVNLSLKNDKVINNFPVLNVKKRFLGLVKIYTIEIPENDIEKKLLTFQENMGTRLNKEWYITVHNADKVFILFRNRTFSLSGQGIRPTYQKMINTENAEDKEMWDEMVRYAKSLGIPDSQCDFLPEDFQEKKYRQI